MADDDRRVSEEGLALWRRLLEAHARVVGALESDLHSACGLSLASYGVLEALHAAPRHRLRMQDLADRVLFSPSGLTRLVDRMAGAGLVTREPCSDDRRGTFAVLLPAGERCLRDAAGVYRRAVHDHFEVHVGVDAVRALDGALTRVLADEAVTAGRAGADPDSASSAAEAAHE
ncbi:MAG: MarR family transcriptional regulator [Acidimicrobiia bacterium]